MSAEVGDSKAQAAARIIWQAWVDGRQIDTLPPACRPEDLTAGYAAQAALCDISGERVVGRKIAATSKAGQKHIGVDGPQQGLLFERFFLTEGASVPNHGLFMSCAEPEFAFRIGDALPGKAGGYTPDDVADATAALHLAIEVPDTRLVDWASAGPAQLLADNACACYFVLGPEVDDWRGNDLAAVAVRGIVNGVVLEEGEGAAALGGPLTALAWLANDAAARGQPLQSGEVITTGTCTVPVPIAPGDTVVAEFVGLGRATATIVR
ncbi:MAG: hydratase [Alphaproteobacteria bacterium]|jgi:2-keto-4-pentenoate hydratase|nr:hydratase [Alphaproteobacteria bacterium]